MKDDLLKPSMTFKVIGQSMKNKYLDNISNNKDFEQNQITGKNTPRTNELYNIM